MNRPDFSHFRIFLLVCFSLLLLLAGRASRAAEGDPIVPTPARTEDTNSLETLRSYLQLQEQLHTTQLAIEQNRKEATASAARTAEALENRLQAIEQALVLQRAHEMEAMQSSNRLILIVAGIIAVLGLATMVLMALSHWRAMSRLGDIATVLPMSRRLEQGEPVAALGPGNGPVVSVSPVDDSNGRLLGVIDRLEKRIYELEHTTQSSAKPPQGHITEGDLVNEEGLEDPDAGKTEMLLGKGATLLHLDHNDEALVCFEAILAENPDHGEALVKKGLALERMRRVDEAIACYDQAILKNSAATMAYLHKGGLYNRLERYSEALECYEKALKTQEKK